MVSTAMVLSLGHAYDLPTLFIRFTQNCKSQLQVGGPNAGRHHHFCSDACTAERLSGLLAGLNPADGSKPVAGVTSRVNTSSTLDMCDVSVCFLGFLEILFNVLLKYCKTKPKYTDASITHPYCGRKCANLAKGKGPANLQAPVPANLSKTTTRPPTPVNISSPLGVTPPAKTRNRSKSAIRSNGNTTAANPINMRNNRLGLYQGTSSSETCQIPECASPVYVGPNGVAGKYCTRKHKQ